MPRYTTNHEEDKDDDDEEQEEERSHARTSPPHHHTTTTTCPLDMKDALLYMAPSIRYTRTIPRSLLCQIRTEAHVSNSRFFSKSINGLFTSSMNPDAFYMYHKQSGSSLKWTGELYEHGNIDAAQFDGCRVRGVSMIDISGHALPVVLLFHFEKNVFFFLVLNVSMSHIESSFLCTTKSRSATILDDLKLCEESGYAYRVEEASNYVRHCGLDHVPEFIKDGQHLTLHRRGVLHLLKLRSFANKEEIQDAYGVLEHVLDLFSLHVEQQPTGFSMDVIRGQNPVVKTIFTTSSLLENKKGVGRPKKIGLPEIRNCAKTLMKRPILASIALGILTIVDGADMDNMGRDRCHTVTTNNLSNSPELKEAFEFMLKKETDHIKEISGEIETGMRCPSFISQNHRAFTLLEMCDVDSVHVYCMKPASIGTATSIGDEGFHKVVDVVFDENDDMEFKKDMIHTLYKKHRVCEMSPLTILRSIAAELHPSQGFLIMERSRSGSITSAQLIGCETMTTIGLTLESCRRFFYMTFVRPFVVQNGEVLRVVVSSPNRTLSDLFIRDPLRTTCNKSLLQDHTFKAVSDCKQMIQDMMNELKEKDEPRTNKKRCKLFHEYQEDVVSGVSLESHEMALKMLKKTIDR